MASWVYMKAAASSGIGPCPKDEPRGDPPLPRAKGSTQLGSFGFGGLFNPL
jgi:hypothetical protein